MLSPQNINQISPEKFFWKIFFNTSSHFQLYGLSYESTTLRSKQRHQPLTIGETLSNSFLV